MTYEGTDKLANVKRSLDMYIKDNLKDTEEFDVDFEGLPFDNQGKKEWVQTRILGVPKVFARQVSTTKQGSYATPLLNINIFVDKSGVTTADRHYMMRDIVNGYFKIGQGIPIRSYVSGTTTILDYMIVGEIITDTVIPDDNYYQYALAYEIRWLEQTTAAS